MKRHNFSAGPCVLPEEVLDKSAKAVLNYAREVKSKKFPLKKHSY